MPDPPQRVKKGRHRAKPWKYAKTETLPDTEEAKAMVLGIEHSMRMPPVPQAWLPDLTGVYEDRTRTIASAVVNHAGNYFAVWIAKFGTSSATQYFGRREDGAVTLSLPKSPWKKVGTLSPGSGKRRMFTVTLEEQGLELCTFERVGRKVTLSSRAIDHLGDSRDAQLVRILEHAPISTRVLRQVREIVIGDEIRALLEEFFDQTEAEATRTVGRKIDKHLQRLGHIQPLPGERRAPLPGPFLDAGHEAHGILEEFALGLMRTQLMPITISSSAWRDEIGATGHESIQSIFDHLADVVAILMGPAVFEPRPATIAATTLGIPSPSERPRYKYEFAVDGEGLAADAGIGLSSFRGKVKIRRIEPTEQEEPFVLSFSLSGASLGPSAGLRIRTSSKGVGTSVIPWNRGDFLGSISSFDAVDNLPTKSTGLSLWTVNGTGVKPPMMVEFGDADTHALEVGVELGKGIGWIREPDDPADTQWSVLPEPAPESQEDYVAMYGGTLDAHFELGSAALSEPGRDAVGWLAATELAPLRNRGTDVFALGSADRVDTAWYNEVLSKMRADNTIQALKDAVGPRFRAKTDTKGLGETLPAGAHRPDGHEDPEFRRVWLSFSGRSVATLKGGKST